MIVGLFQQSDERTATMAERARMTAAQLADKLMSDEHADVVRESVVWMARELMEAEVAEQDRRRAGRAQPGADHSPQRLPVPRLGYPGR
jgi:hypothetical protein